MNRRAMIRVRLRAACLAGTLALSPSFILGGCKPAATQAQPKPPLAGAKIGGDFALVDKDGRTVRYGDFAGRYRIVYFGYTFCPDVCPLDLQKLAQALKLVEQREPEVAARIQPIFITIDPQRDTPKVVGEFTAAFSPRLLGLTGNQQQVAAAEKAFAVYARKQPSSSGYLMDHSRIAYLMDRDGKPLALLPVDQAPPAIAAEIERWTT